MLIFKLIIFNLFTLYINLIPVFTNSVYKDNKCYITFKVLFTFKTILLNKVVYFFNYNSYYFKSI